MNYYIIYNYMPLKVKVIKLNGLDQRYIKHDNEYYIKITKARYIKLKRKLDSKLKKEFEDIMILLDTLNSNSINEKEIKCNNINELDVLYSTYLFFHDKLKAMPWKFFKSLDERYRILDMCESKKDYYHQAYIDAINETLKEENDEYEY